MRGAPLVLVLVTAWTMLLACGCSETGISGPPPPPSGEPVPIGPTEHTDVILQVVNPVVDVLWVLDNSGSMTDDRAAVASAFPDFIRPFDDLGTDYHIGVITTDMETEGHRGVLQPLSNGARWLSPDTPALANAFTHLATEALLSDTGANEERGRDAIYHALEVHSGVGSPNEGFLRPDWNGWLHVTVITDEEDATPDGVLPVSSFVELLKLRKPFPDRLTFNSIVSWVDYGGATRGDSYMAITHQVGGVLDDVQGADWDQLMPQLGGLQAPDRPEEEFFLTRLPLADSIDVEVTVAEGATVVYESGRDYAYDPQRNSIVFNKPPPVGSLVRIRYRARGDGDVVVDSAGR